MTPAEKAVAQRIRDEEQRKAVKAANFVTVKLQSGEVRLIDREACATVGVASNASQKYAQLGKAGRSRWLGIRPTVRGLAMNAMDHPHGGGRGKSKGNVHPVSPWGKPVISPAPTSELISLILFGRPNQGSERGPREIRIRLSLSRERETRANGGGGGIRGSTVGSMQTKCTPLPTPQHLMLVSKYLESHLKKAFQLFL